MHASEGVDSNGGGGGGDRVVLHGDSSRSQGRGAMDFQSPYVVVLDLSKERAALKTRWLVVGLFFSLQAFSSEGLFGELRDKWGLRGKMKYTQLKNNRYLLEFEREGDRRFIINNDPWSYKGDAFLMVTADGNTPPGDVEIAHMPIWVKIYDVPLVMLSEPVAWQLGALLGEVLAVGTDSEGNIWGDFLRVRIKHDVDLPLTRDIKTRELGMCEDEVKNLYTLEVKYERLPRFCMYCGRIGHGQRDCKLPEDLQKMRFTAALRGSPLKRKNGRGGYVAPDACSA
ncbi:uncharacterized protein [Aegilops tauschii subsp. strangulata]|uniref:uncharacterized protein n=1 Tax=Aegilops tauschii subsp. strangulata TaxID=200361 RepID=UPI003CC8D13C